MNKFLLLLTALLFSAGTALFSQGKTASATKTPASTQKIKKRDYTMLDREKVEWSQHYWCDTDDNTLPRVLLIGDVSDRLKGIATVAAFSSSKIVGDPGFYRELQLALADYPVDLICINNGLHGTPYSDEFYRERLKELVLFLRQNTRARLTWRNSTPITVRNEPEKLAELNEMVLHRNRIAEEIMKELHVPVLDLYTPMAEHPEYSAKDG